jgi:hypothetical protein
MPDVYAESNQLLKFLSDNCDADWISVYEGALGPAELDSNIENVQKALKKFNLDKPVGAVLGGTGALKKAAGIGSQEAVQILKNQGRIVQAGKGRGKAVCILDSTPLAGYTMDTVEVHVETPNPPSGDHSNCVPVDNMPALISALALAAFDQDKRLKEANKQAAIALVKNTELQMTLKERTQELEEARAELDKLQNTNIATTWS